MRIRYADQTSEHLLQMVEDARYIDSRPSLFDPTTVMMGHYALRELRARNWQVTVNRRRVIAIPPVPEAPGL